jgi:hypothetical protein
LGLDSGPRSLNNTALKLKMRLAVNMKSARRAGGLRRQTLNRERFQE